MQKASKIRHFSYDALLLKSCGVTINVENFDEPEYSLSTSSIYSIPLPDNKSKSTSPNSTTGISISDWNRSRCDSGISSDGSGSYGARPSSKLSQDSGKLSQDSGKLSQDSGKLSQDSSKLSQDSGKLSQDSGKLSQDSGKLSQDSEELHADSGLSGSNSETEEGDSETKKETKKNKGKLLSFSVKEDSFLSVCKKITKQNLTVKIFEQASALLNKGKKSQQGVMMVFLLTSNFELLSWNFLCADMFPCEDSKTLSVCPYPENKKINFGFVIISTTLVIDT